MDKFYEILNSEPIQAVFSTERAMLSKEESVVHDERGLYRFYFDVADNYGVPPIASTSQQRAYHEYLLQPKESF